MSVEDSKKETEAYKKLPRKCSKLEEEKYGEGYRKGVVVATAVKRFFVGPLLYY